MSLRADFQDHAGAEGVLFNVVVSTASVVGDDYFSVLPRVLANALNVSGAFVAEVLAGELVRLLGVHPQSDLLSGSLVELAVEPAARGTLAFVPRAAQRAFPADAILKSAEADACLAVPIHGSIGSVLGVIGIVDAVEIPTTFPGESVLRLLAPRVGAEIERRRAMDEVHAVGELIRTLTERSQDVITRYRVKPDFAFEYVSPSFERVFGYSPDEMYGDPSVLFRLIHPDQTAELAALISGDDTVSRDGRWIGRDGKTIWTEGRRTAIRDASGQVIAYESFTRDVTAQHEIAEELARARVREHRLLDALPDTMFRLSPDGLISDFRAPRAVDPPFIPPAPDATIDDVFPDDVCDKFRAALLEASSTPVQNLRFEVDAVGMARAIDARLVADGDEVVVFLRDVTGDEWLAHEVARQRSRDEIEGAAERRVARPNPYSLTFREFTVLDLVRSGATDKELAATLGISASTGSKHVSNILAKMNAASRTQAVARAMAEGLLD